MWKKILIIIMLFYFFALLQNSFLAHFSFFGATPSLVFIFFFLLVFFENKRRNYLIIFYAALAGILLDIFSYTYLGPSLVLLMIVGFLLKGIQSLLKNRDDKFPFVYFLPLFVISLIIYELVLGLFAYFSGEGSAVISIAGIILSVIYNSVLASALFYLYKWQRNTK